METVPQLLKYGSATHNGNVRNHNEDCYASEVDLGLWLIADGMGGYKNGEIASSIACDTVVQSVRQGETLSDSIQIAHQSILKSGEEGVGSPGMGTTIVAIKISGTSYEIAWVGDSRAYIYDGEKLRQLSKDHSYVQLLVDKGAITQEESIHHQQKNLIVQCLGSLEHKTLEVSTLSGEFLRGQKILLCSDGLNDEISDQEIESMLKSDVAEQIAVDNLINAVLAKEGKDNVTVLLISAPDTAPDNFSTTKTLINEVPAPNNNSFFLNNKIWITIGVVLFLALVASWEYHS